MLTCEVCNDLWHFVTEPAGEKQSINLGSFQEALSSQCRYHTPLLDAFKQYCHGDGEDPAAKASDVGFVRGDTGYSAHLYESTSRLGRYWEFLAATRETGSNAGKGRILDPDWVDLKAVIEWKRDCISSHGAKCENPLKIPPIRPAWLIDVENRCVVSGEGSVPYIALSYRSSDAAAYRLHQTTLEEFQKQGALDDPEISTRLPLKIRHAISLTSAMGEQYLWADALCIERSDPILTSEQVNLMSSIYAGAISTIVAADGDREDGITGPKDISQPRRFKQKVFSTDRGDLIVRNSHEFSLEHGHEYHKRGWTYQEFKLSPRKLLFMRGQAHWQCNTCVWHEELTYGSEIDTYIDPRPGVLSSGFPDLGSLGHSLSAYNRRDLTYDEDALAAISGLLTLFSRTFTGGFLYGLPEMLFDRALAWQPQWPHTNMRRRMASSQANHICFNATDLPSWSWVAWQGMITFWYGEPARVNDRQYFFDEVSPITEWYTSSAPSGQPLRRIRSTWFEERDRRKDVNQPLPTGWKRLPAPRVGSFRNEPMLYPDGCGQFLYEHQAISDDDCRTWYYPFNVPDIQLTTPHYVPDQTRYLFCKTLKVSVWSHRTLDKHTGEDTHVVTLRRTADRHSEPAIGSLHLQTDDQLKLWPKPASDDQAETDNKSALGKTIELVAINSCVHYSKTFNSDAQRYDHPLERQERITVLWVEWNEGVAYRLACGHVVKSDWDSLNPQSLDLVLG